MRTKTFDPKEGARAINIFRMALKGTSFTREEFKQLLKEDNIPINDVFFNTLRKSPVLTQVGKNQFKFSNPKTPVYWSVIDRVYKDYQTKIRNYRETYKKKITV